MLMSFFRRYSVHSLSLSVFCGICLGVSSCGVIPSATSHSHTPSLAKDILLIGTYTDASSEGIYTFNLDKDLLRADHVGTLKTPSPSYLALDEERSLLFAVNETNDQPSLISARMDPGTGELKLINRTPTLGKGPAYLTYHRGAVISANYQGGSLTLVEVESNGALGSPDWRIELTTGEVSHPHAVVFVPGKERLYVTDLGQDKIFAFNFRPSVPPLTLDQEVVKLPKGTGPRHIVFDKKGKYAYVIGELRPVVVVYAVSSSGLTPVQEISTEGEGGKGGGHIALSPDGRYLYTTHRLRGDGIVIFRIDSSTGQLVRVGHVSTGSHPRHFAFSPDGRYMAVACKDADRIQFYQRDLSSGALSKMDLEIKVSHPAFVLWKQSE